MNIVWPLFWLAVGVYIIVESVRRLKEGGARSTLLSIFLYSMMLAVGTINVLISLYQLFDLVYVGGW